VAGGEEFEVFFQRHFTAVLAYARRRTDPAAADEVVANTFVTAWRRRDDIPSGHELAWLYATARRHLANHRRGEARRLRLLERLQRERPGDLPTRDDTITAALARLRPEDCEILRLAAWEDLPPAEIAVVLGCSVNAASLRLSRARGRLRNLLTDKAVTRTQAEWKGTDA
jgi:RNA polymerase sigma-70 factor (ECF subfamily)